MYEAKQMTTAQAVGAASHTPGGFSTAVRIGSKPVSSRPYSFCIRPRPRFSGGRFWVLEPDEGKPSSPVLRGLGASNGARLLDDSAFTRLSFTIPLAITRPRISGTGTFPRQATVRVLPEWMTCRFERTTACASYSLFFS